MQRYTIDPGFDNHQLTGGKHVSADNMATSAVGGRGDTVRALAKCVSHFGDLTALCAHRSPHDQQRDSSSWWSGVFRNVTDSAFCVVMVAAAERDQAVVRRKEALNGDVISNR